MDRRNTSGHNVNQGSDATPRRQAARAHDPRHRASLHTARVLVISANRVQRDVFAAQLSGKVGALVCVENIGAAQALIERGDADVVLVDAADVAGRPKEFCDRCAGVAVVLMAEHPTLEDAIDAIKHGVSDVIAMGTRGPELLMRVEAALHRGRELRVRDEKIDKLRRLAKKLNQARQQITQNIGGLCSDLTTAYSDLSDKLTLVGAASEFNSLVRQELEIENLLRAVLEYVLTKTGPTNAAIFLPSSSGDFTLGAYVNYDGPKDSAEVLLDHLASGLAPKFENTHGVQMMVGKNQIAARAGNVGDWVGDVTMMTFACHNNGECLAVATLFRDRRNPFPETLVPLLDLLSDLFAKQLARVVHVHHRHLPPSKWGKHWEQQDPDDNLPDIDLAA